MDLIRGMLFLSRGSVWGRRSGTGGNKVWGMTARGSLWNKYLLDREHGRSWHTAAKYSLPGHFQGSGGSARAQNSGKWSFHVGWEQGKSSVTPAGSTKSLGIYRCIYLFPAPFGDL